jgi:cytochrome P450
VSGTVSKKTASGMRQLLPLPYGALGRARRDPLGFLMDGWREHGDVFRYRLGPLVFHLVAHPDHVKHVLLDNAKNYPRSWYYGRIKVVVGDGLVTTEGAPWRRLRRMVQPSFHHEKVRALAGVMTNAIVAMRVRWGEHATDGRPVNVEHEFMELTLRIVGRALLSIDLGGKFDRIGPALTTCLAFGEHRVNNLLGMPVSVPTPRNLRYRKAVRAIDEIVYAIIADRRRTPGKETGDLLSLLMAVRDDETGEGLSDRELRDQLFTFIAAGHETTAVALTWTIYLLSQYPEAAARLAGEIAEVLGQRTPTADDLPRLAYTRRVIEESLRLYPPVFALIRDAQEDDEIGGYHIPARSTVILSPYVTQRHPGVWPDPATFDPDRFLPDRSAGRSRFAWFPFLGGAHQCIGQEFAMMEAVLVVAMLAQSYRFRLAPGAVVEPGPVLSLRPRFGMSMTIYPTAQDSDKSVTIRDDATSGHPGCGFAG